MEHAIETEVGRLAVFEEGRGPVLFFWPSLYLDHRSFEAVIGELASERRCVVVDGPGHGRSPGPGRPYDMATCARAAIQVLDALGIAAVDWVGNAWGGAVGVRAAIDSPERLRIAHRDRHADAAAVVEEATANEAPAPDAAPGHGGPCGRAGRWRDAAAECRPLTARRGAARGPRRAS